MEREILEKLKIAFEDTDCEMSYRVDGYENCTGCDYDRTCAHQILKDIIVEEEDVINKKYSYGRPGYWKQKNGKEIKISAMTTQHLSNTLNLIDNRIAQAFNAYHDTDFEIDEELQQKIDELNEEVAIREERKYKRRK